jgi:hypothetical protein
MDSEHYLVSGIYTLICGLALFMTGMIVGDEALQMRDYDPQSYQAATGGYGIASQIMLVCQIGGVLVTLFGLLKLAVVVERLVVS